MSSDRKAELRNQMVVALLKDKILHLEVYTKLFNLSEISISQIKEHYKEFPKLEDYHKNYKEAMSGDKSSPEWLSSIENIVKKIREEVSEIDSNEFAKSIKKINSTIKATSNREPKVILILTLRK